MDFCFIEGLDGRRGNGRDSGEQRKCCRGPVKRLGESCLQAHGGLINLLIR